MPSIPKTTKCNQLGCKNNKAKLSGFCIEHGGKDVYQAKSSEERRAFNSMYDTKSWKILRISQLSRQPLCAACLSQGRIVQAEHVDHLFKWSAIGKHAFFNNVFQSLCSPCHSHKTSLERQGIFRHYTPEATTDYEVADWQRITSAPSKMVETA